MKTYLLLALAAASLTATSCKKDDPESSLPPATQEGKNTAGCLINGEQFVATGYGSGLGKVEGVGGGFAFDSAYYLRLNGRFGNREGSLHLFLNAFPRFKNRALVGKYALNKNTPYMPAALSDRCQSYATFFPNDNQREVFGTTADFVGNVQITYVNENNRIAAGTFEFTAVSNLDPSKTIRVTSGRFDRQQ